MMGEHHIDASAAIPLYRQIYALLKSKIESGEYPFNTRLPAEEQLSANLGVSRITIKRAMSELAASGLITRLRGKGTIVSFNSQSPTVRGNYTTPLDHLRQLGLETEVRLISRKEVPAGIDVATELLITPETMVQRVERVRYLEDSPFSHITNYTVKDVADKIPLKGLENKSFTELFHEAGHTISSTDQTIIAKLATGSTTRHLMLSEGAPILCIRRVLKDQAKRAIQFTISNYRADRYQYHMVIPGVKPTPGTE